MKATAIRERIERLMTEERIPYTDEQVAAIIRVAMNPKWPDAERWEASVIERAVTALKAYPRKRSTSARTPDES